MVELPASRWTPILVRVVVTAGVLGLLLVWLPIDALFAAMRRVTAPLWLLVLLGFAAGHLLAAFKWRLLLRASGVRPGATETLRAYGAGLFANLCLPSLVGGDVVRAGLVARRHGHLEAVAVGGLADRILDTAALVGLAALGAAATPGEVGSLPGRALVLSSLALFGGLLGAPLALRHLDAALLPRGLERIVRKLRAALDGLLAQPGAAFAALGASLAIQSGFVLLNAALGAAVGIALPLSVWFLAWPLAKLVALVPVSLGGIGVREGALAALLLPFAVNPVLAVAQSLLWETVLVALGLTAGAASLWLRRAADGGPSVVAGDAG